MSFMHEPVRTVLDKLDVRRRRDGGPMRKFRYTLIRPIASVLVFALGTRLGDESSRPRYNW